MVVVQKPEREVGERKKEILTRKFEKNQTRNLKMTRGITFFHTCKQVRARTQIFGGREVNRGAQKEIRVSFLVVEEGGREGMEVVVKKYQQKYRKVRDELDRWDQFQTRLITQFRNASSIMVRLPVLQDSKNYVGGLECVNGLMETLIGKQMMSLETILGSMDETMKEFHSIVVSLEKNLRDGRQLVKGGSMSLAKKQIEMHIGVLPSIAECLEGLRLLHEMHHSEYLLKLSAVSKLTPLLLKSSCASDLSDIEQDLVNQPNIQKEEVQRIFEIIFAEDTV